MLRNIIITILSIIAASVIAACSAQHSDSKKTASEPHFTGLSVYKDPVTGKFINAPVNTNSNNSELKTAPETNTNNTTPQISNAHDVNTIAGGKRITVLRPKNNNQ